MVQKVQLKRTATPGKIPTTSDIDLGEVGINTYDGKLYIKKNNGVESIVEVTGAGAGTGVTAGTYSKLTVNSSGLVTAGSPLYASDINLMFADSQFSAAGAVIGGNLIMTSGGTFIYGDFSNATPQLRTRFITSTVNSFTNVGAAPNGTGTSSAFNFWNSSDIPNANSTQINCTPTASQILSLKNGTASYLPLTFHTGGFERLKVDTNGYVLVNTPAAPIGTVTVNGNISATGSPTGYNPTTTGGWMNAAYRTSGSWGGGIALVDGTTSGFGMFVDTGATRLVFGYGTSTTVMSGIITMRSGGDVNINNYTYSLYNNNTGGDVAGAYPFRVKGTDTNNTMIAIGENNTTSYVSGFYKNSAGKHIAMGHINFATYNNTAGAEQGYVDILAKLSTADSYSTANGVRLDFNRNFYHSVDNVSNLGWAGGRWAIVFAGTGAINTSDAREKTTITALTVAEITAAQQFADEIGSYKWLESVAEKGDAARTHIGFTVQRAIEILEANNLVANKYGFICYDEWEAAVDSDGNVLHTAGNRYGFRYDQLNTFIIAGLNQKMKTIEARLAALEA